LRKLCFQFTRRAKRGAAAHRFLDGFHNARVCVAEDKRPPRTDVIEVLVAVHVVEIRPLAARHEERLTAHAAKRAGRAVHAAGNNAAGPLEGFAATDADGWHGIPFGRYAMKAHARGERGMRSKIKRGIKRKKKMKSKSTSKSKTYRGDV